VTVVIASGRAFPIEMIVNPIYIDQINKDLPR